MIRNYDDPLTMCEHHQIGKSAVERDMARAKRVQDRHIEKMLTEIDRVQRSVQRVDRIALGFFALVGTIGVVSWLLTLGLLHWLTTP